MEPMIITEAPAKELLPIEVEEGFAIKCAFPHPIKLRWLYSLQEGILALFSNEMSPEDRTALTRGDVGIAILRLVTEVEKRDWWQEAYQALP